MCLRRQVCVLPSVVLTKVWYHQHLPDVPSALVWL